MDSPRFMAPAPAAAASTLPPISPCVVGNAAKLLCPLPPLPLQVRSGLSVMHIGDVSLPIALGLWLMMLPVLTKVQYEKLGSFLADKATARQMGVSFVLNWLLGPALMTGLAWACLPDLPGFRNGVIMVGLAR